MSGRPKKKNPKTKESMNALLIKAVKLYAVPFDDRKGERRPELPSVRSVAEEMKTSIWRIRKLLITAGYYSTETSREVQRRSAEGQTIEEIIQTMGIKKASVYSYLPYKDLAYNLDQTTVNADRHKLFRQRKKAVQKLLKAIDSPAAGDSLWEAIILFAGYPFQTAKGLRFSYTVKTGRSGETVGEIQFDRKEKSITRATISLAFERALEIERKEGFVKGPKKLGVFGASYIYPVFVRLGIITPPSA